MNSTGTEPVKVGFWGWVITIAVVFLMIWGVERVVAWMITPSTSAPAQEANTHSHAEAYAEAQEILKKYLKSPATAQFPPMREVTFEDFGDGAFKVSGYVDAQNSFGALLRQDWQMIFQFVEGDRVDITIVTMDNKLLFKKDTVK